MLIKIWIFLNLIINHKLQALPPQISVSATISSITISPEMLREIASQVPRPIKQHYLNRACCSCCCSPSLYWLYKNRDPIYCTQKQLAAQESLSGPDALKTLALLRLGYLHEPELQNQIAQSLQLQISDAFEVRQFYPHPRSDYYLMIEHPTIKITDLNNKQSIQKLFRK